MRVAVIGAGPAGCAAALALRRRGLDVVLVGDGATAVGEQLPPSARPLLEHLRLWPPPEQLECVAVRSAWGGPELSDQDFVFHPFGKGWLLDRQSFGAWLQRAACDAGVELIQPAHLESLQREGAWHLQLSCGELRCDWVIDASGRRNAVARALGVKRRRFDRQVALVRRFATDADDPDATLTVESGEGGWWYTCRIPGRRRVAAWIGAERVERDEWPARLAATRHVRARLAGYCPDGEGVIRAADSSLLERSWGAAWLAIGDAAVSYDPLASRGLVSALASGIEAATLVDAAETTLAARHADLEARFHAYLRQRQAHYAYAGGRH